MHWLCFYTQSLTNKFILIEPVFTSNVILKCNEGFSPDLQDNIFHSISLISLNFSQY